MHLFYIDASGEQGKYYVYTALAIHDGKWRPAFNKIKKFRQELKKDYGLRVDYELHAWKFLSGKGDLGPKLRTKESRYEVFQKTLEFMCTVDGFRLFNSVNVNEQYAFERMVNRIERTMKERKSRAMLICDEGEEQTFIRRIRKMNVFNHIPSNRGAWSDDGTKTRNITLEHIIEDPIFKNSEESYFVQLADFCAYALLRMDRPIPDKAKYGLPTMFKILEPICFKGASPRDAMGVIR